MSEPITESSATIVPSVEAQQAQDAEPKTFDADYVGKLRAEAAKYRTEAKANADAARKLAEYEEAQKSEAQKLADRLAAAEAKALAAELKALRSDVAQAKGVPASLLTGSTEDELNASADALLSFKGKPNSAPPAAGTQGNVGKPIGTGSTDIDSQIAAAQAAGDWRRALSLTNSKLADLARKE